MTFKIHFEHQDGTPDHFVITGETVGDIRKQAYDELAKRNGRNHWSEEVT